MNRPFDYHPSVSVSLSPFLLLSNTIILSLTYMYLLFLHLSYSYFLSQWFPPLLPPTPTLDAVKRGPLRGGGARERPPFSFLPPAAINREPNPRGGRWGSFRRRIHRFPSLRLTRHCIRRTAETSKNCRRKIPKSKSHFYKYLHVFIVQYMYIW